MTKLKSLLSLLPVFLVFIILNLSIISISAQNQTIGDTEFWFVAPDASAQHSDKPAFLLIATGNQPATVNVTMGGAYLVTNQYIAANSYFQYDFTWYGSTGGAENAYTSSGTVTNKGLHITSTANIIAYYQIDGTNQKEIFTFKGRNALGTNFYLPFRQEPRTTGFTDGFQQIQIVATENNTTVTLEPTVTGVFDNTGAGPATINSSSSVADRTRTLNKGETLLWRAKDKNSVSLTSTRIFSDKPIAITLFDDCVVVSDSEDPIGDQIVPVDKLGSQYIVVKGFTEQSKTAREYVGVLAVENNTSVTCNGTTVNLNTGDFYSFNLGAGDVLPGSYHVDATKPIYCMHFSGGGNEVGGALVPSLSSISARKTVFRQGNLANNHVFLVFRSSAANSFTINGNPMPITPMNTSLANWQYARYSLSASTQGQIINIENTAGPFGAGYFMNGPLGNISSVYGYLSNFGYEVFPTDTMYICSASYHRFEAPMAESYLWTLPDGTTIEDSVSILATQSGRYILDMVQNNINVLDTTFLIFQNFRNSLSYTNPICVRDTCQFSVTLNSTNDTLNIFNANYEWSFPGANISSVTHIGRSDSVEVVDNIRWNLAGTKTVQLKITNTDISCDTTIIFSVVVNPAAVLTNPGNQIFCVGTNTTEINFTGTNVEEDSTLWANDNSSIGLPSSGKGKIPSFNATTAGTATITVTPVSSKGCQGTPVQFTITVKSVQINDLQLDDLVYCSGDTVPEIDLTGNSFNMSYDWINNNTSIGLVSSGSGTIPSFEIVNTKTVGDTARIIVFPISLDGCLIEPDTFIIVVNPTPKVNAALSDLTYCAEDTVFSILVRDNVQEGVTYSWTNNNSDIGLGLSGIGDSIPLFIATNMGIDPAKGTITVTPTLDGCVGEAKSFEITINPMPRLREKTSDLAVCANQDVPEIIFESNTPGAVFSWTSSNPDIVLPPSGTGNIPAFKIENVNDSISTTIVVTPVFNGCVGISDTFTITVLSLVRETRNDTICYGQEYVLGSQILTQQGTYTELINSLSVGCDTLVTLHLTVNPAIDVWENELPRICAGDNNFIISYSESPYPDFLKPTHYSVVFDPKSISAGFSDFSESFSGDSMEILIPLPTNIYPDTYNMKVTLYGQSNCQSLIYNVLFDVYYPESIMDQKWDDVVALKNSRFNGGFEFYGYQWYRNGNILPGETHSYIYLGENNVLTVGDEYYVNITRNDGSTMFSCPIIARIANPPLTVTPTLVQPGGIITVNTNKKHMAARFWTPTGILIKSENIAETKNQINAPSLKGTYILELIDNEDGVRKAFNIVIQDY